MLQEEKIINYIKKKQNQKARIESELTQLELMIDILKNNSPSTWSQGFYYLIKSFIILLIVISPIVLFFVFPSISQVVAQFWHITLIIILVLLYILRLNNIIHKNINYHVYVIEHALV